jgi:hypothetical protein
MYNYVVSSVTQRIVDRYLPLSNVIAKGNFLTLLDEHRIK